MTRTLSTSGCLRSDRLNSLRPIGATARNPRRRMGASYAATSGAGRSNGSLPGCRTTVASWCATTTNSATTWALFTSVPSLLSCVAIIEMTSSTRPQGLVQADTSVDRPLPPQHFDRLWSPVPLQADTAALATVVEYVAATYGIERLPVLLAAAPRHTSWHTLISEVFETEPVTFKADWQSF